MAQKDRYAQYLLYATLVTFIPFLGTKLFQLRQTGIFGGIMEENEDVWFQTKKLYKIWEKYICTITEITLSQKVTVVWGQYAKRAQPIWLKISGKLILLPNLNVSKKPYPSHALGRSVCLGQGCIGVGCVINAYLRIFSWTKSTFEMRTSHSWTNLDCGQTSSRSSSS